MKQSKETARRATQAENIMNMRQPRRFAGQYFKEKRVAIQENPENTGDLFRDCSHAALKNTRAEA